MKDLIELVTYLRDRPPALSDALITSAHAEDENLYLKLFHAIAKEQVQSDEQAAHFLYGAAPSEKKYQMLKVRLKERLINSIFLIPRRKISPASYFQMYHQCMKNYFAAQILLCTGARLAATSLAKASLNMAIKYEFNEFKWLTARILRNDAALRGAGQEVIRYNEIIHKALQAIRLENRAEHLYDMLLAQTARTRSHRPDTGALAKSAYQKCREMVKYRSSFNLQVTCFRIGMIYYQLIKDYPKLIKHLDQFESFLRRYPHAALPARRGEIALVKMVACIYLRDFAQGKRNAEEALRNFRHGSNNWFIVMENYFLLCMQALEFDLAEQLLDQTTRHERYAFQSTIRKETWKVFEAYLVYARPARKEKSPFRIDKFLNEVPIFYKDKSGLYPAVLIAQVLFLFDSWNEQRLERCLESLRIYASRYLKMAYSPRTIHFIKIMRILFNFHYDPKKAEARIAQKYQAMQQALSAKREELDTLEIIPYEYLCQKLIRRIHEVAKK